MKSRHLAAALIVTAAVGAGGAGVALAQQEDPPGGDGVRGEFVCGHLDQIEQLQAGHATLLQDRLALLGEARAGAEAAGNAEAVERIDRRVERVNERTAKVTQRQGRLATFAAEHCS
jgi:hypothetical protein